MSQDAIQQANKVLKHLNEASEAAKPIKDPQLHQKIREAETHIVRKLDPTAS